MPRDWANDPPEGFDWDPPKYVEVLQEHRVRLEIAALVFGDPDRLERYDDRDDYGEDRFSVIGLAGGRVLRVAFTLRGEHDEITRIITGFAARPPNERPMSETGDIDADERRCCAEARLAASRPSREAAAAVHARDITRGEQGGDGMVRKSLAEVAANSRHFTVEERARLLAMTEEEIEAAALADPDNPPWTAEELEQAARERDARLAAAKRGA